MSISQVSGGKVWTIPCDDKPAVPTIPQKHPRAQMELQDKFVIGAVGTVILVLLGMLNTKHNIIDMTNLVLINKSEVSTNDGYIYRKGEDNMIGALSVIITVLVSCAIVFTFIKIIHDKPQMKKTFKAFLALIPLTALFLALSYSASVSQVLENKMSMQTWAKERYNVSIPRQDNSTAVDGALFRNTETNEILELTETNGKLFIHSANGEELPIQQTINDQTKGLKP